MFALQNEFVKRIPESFLRKLGVFKNTLNHGKKTVRTVFFRLLAIRTWCLRFHGFDKEQHENIVNKITNFTNTRLGLNLSTYEIENYHNVGPPRNGYRRPIIVRYFSRATRQQILHSTYLLKQKKSKIFVEDLTKRTLASFHGARNSVSDTEKKSIVTRNGDVYQKQSDKSL
ncbi:unnamed protein product [Didymodactylos carnosus]|uniref:Uncharacterized protein n=1 Tax=Didymodactylos carnosus TaxID=1234261 RepID=A0A814FDH9_9BILA|nr:unnamed protein product [Didymodactylos carnosus]CAF1140962.1 unnamed protein product [Didymodactylos carnosus]CAF3751259.1 unnamed protein product [Didymodactylos carnosus]CAF3936169.1 unnamed protein product [Didymodactylos carnosus]